MTIGRKTGGRKKGVPNRTTAAKAETIAAERRASGAKLAVDVLSQTMNYFVGMAARYQVMDPENPTRTNPQADEKKFVQYLKMAAEIAGSLAPYESPKLQSTVLRGAGQGGEIVHKIEIEYV